MKFLGFPYPVVSNPRGLLATQGGVDQIKSDLLCLLLTNPGERVMIPDFGTPLRELIFEPNDDVLVNKAREVIITAIKTWEPRVTIDQIEISAGADSNSLNVEDTREEMEHILSIKIMFFDPENIKDVQELKLEIPLASQGA